jgi:hypothetical protein
MRRAVFSIMGAVAGVSLLVGLAFADHNEPQSARRLQAELVTAYAPCTSPNTVTDDPGFPGFPACTPALREDPQCGFGSTGSAEVTFQFRRDGEITATAAAAGLDMGCTGEQLNLFLEFQGTSDACSGGPCTLVSTAQTQFVGCIVTPEGVCRISFTGPLSMPSQTGFELLGCGLLRVGAVRPAFKCGLLKP